MFLQNTYWIFLKVCLTNCMFSQIDVSMSSFANCLFAWWNLHAAVFFHPFFCFPFFFFVKCPLNIKSYPCVCGLLFDPGNIQMASEVNNKTWASCEYQMCLQIASETNVWAVSSVTDGAMSIMNFFVKHLNVKSLALLFCASLMFDAARCNLQGNV